MLRVILAQQSKKTLLMKKILLIIALILVFTLSNCLNSYETGVIGEYELHKYELKNTKIGVDNFSKLLLKKDKKFELKYGNKTITGNWKADDYGDWTLIELNVNNNVTEGKILNNSILFENDKIFEFDNFKNMEYTRIGNRK